MDYSLLRPFDLEAAKAGGELVCTHDGSLRKYVAGPDTEDKIIVTDADGVFQKSMYYREHYVMAPLAWVEGRPVYKGDALYFRNPAEKHLIGESRTVVGRVGPNALGFENGRRSWVDCLTWDAPEVKREGRENIYPELLEVVHAILAPDMIQYLPAEYVAKVRSVIAKATGG